ncbi:MAG: exodeoxyribonuclease III [Thiohalomonadaceae bacterium]|jgi:exodeoxyribonuclease-3
MKIASWNVNSLRVRLPQVIDWLALHKPDVLALQETKLPDEKFPQAEIEDAGYKVVFSGQNTYNGVALLSKSYASGTIITDLPGLDDPQRRVLGAQFGDIYVLNLYVPNGAEVGSDKYAYKLDWLGKLQDLIKAQIQATPNLVVLGDFNIAPDDRDVYDPTAWQGRILCSEPEREAFQKLLAAGLVDTFRLFEQPEKSYSWWDYRQLAFRRNMGLRIDHILASLPLAERCVSASIDKEPRKLERPSDHAPVVAEFS